MQHPIDSRMINADINALLHCTECYLKFINYIEKPKGNVYGILVETFSVKEKKCAITLCKSAIARKKLPLFIEDAEKNYFRIYHKHIKRLKQKG